MARRDLMLIPLMLACLTLSGCFKSESDYQEVVDRKEQRQSELAVAEKENEILQKALSEIQAEHQALQNMVSAGRSGLAESGFSAGALDAADDPLPPPTNQDVVSWGGWEWPIPPDAVPETSSPGRGGGSSSGRVYKPQPGDVLSTIATRHNTTVKTLVELNPFLKDRRNFMIRESDEILLP